MIRSRKDVHEVIDRIDDFIVGADVDTNPREDLDELRDYIDLRLPDTLHYGEMITGICSAIASIADAYGGEVVYNDYLNKATRNLLDALHEIEVHNGN